MPLLDERGRLFGKINLIDAAVAAFVLLLIPLAYASYLLFKAPAPVITAITPTALPVAKGATIEIQGQHLRPFFRAFAGPTPVEYLFASPDLAKLTLPDLPSGTYEITLYDEAQVVAKGPSISVSPRVEQMASVLAIGTFNRLQDADVAAIRQGTKLVAVAGATPEAPAAELVEVLGVRPATSSRLPLEPNAPPFVEVGQRQQVTAVVRLQGHLAGRDLIVAGTKISPGAELTLPVEATRPVAFVVQRAYPEKPTFVDVRMRLITRPEIFAIAQRDISSAARDPFDALLPRLLSARITSELDGETKLDRREGRLAIVEALVRVPAVRVMEGWSYDGKPLRPGVEFVVDTPAWQMPGMVLSMEAKTDVQP